MSKENRYKELIAPFSRSIAGSEPQNWADLGCGSGVFTQILAEVLPSGSNIFAVDQTPQKLADIMGNNVSVSFQLADFQADQLELNSLDGILMANSFHYVRDKELLIKNLEYIFKAKGQFLIVEYDTNEANAWVPFPITFEKCKLLFNNLGYRSIKRLNDTKSIYGGVMYAAHIV